MRRIVSITLLIAALGTVAVARAPSLFASTSLGESVGGRAGQLVARGARVHAGTVARWSGLAVLITGGVACMLASGVACAPRLAPAGGPARPRGPPA
jgi:predicted metal-binding membrane protein